VWTDRNRKVIKPDFFIENSNGYSDILEFKLPNIKNSTITGIENREAFSAEINSYIAQTRVYSEYFDDPANRQYVKEKYGINVLKPKRILVVGRRYDFNSDDWKIIQNDFSAVEIWTYDDLVATVSAHLYMD
jgi:hypothetical protein